MFCIILKILSLKSTVDLYDVYLLLSDDTHNTHIHMHTGLENVHYGKIMQGLEKFAP